MCITPISLQIDSIKFQANIPLTASKSRSALVPCGQCIECRGNYINQWVFRLIEEFKSKRTKSAYFITLTYEDAELYNLDNKLISEDGEHTLNYTHFQKFVKRLRKSYSYRAKNPDTGKMKTYYDKVPNIKYFCTGEYGERTDRPHFHAIIFNADQQNILTSWKFGNVHFGGVTEASVRYTLKYAMKKIERVYKKDRMPVNEILSKLPEKALISQGIGETYLNDKTIKFYNENIERQALQVGGAVSALPRYYKQKIYDEAKQTARSRLALKRMEEKSTNEELIQRQAIAHRKFKSYEAKKKSRKNSGY